MGAFLLVIFPGGFALPEGCRMFLFEQPKRNRKSCRYFRGAGHGSGAARPRDPQRRSRIEKTGKNAWKDCFSIGFSDSPLLIRGARNPRPDKMVSKKARSYGPCLFGWNFFGPFFVKKGHQSALNSVWSRLAWAPTLLYSRFRYPCTQASRSELVPNSAVWPSGVM